MLVLSRKTSERIHIGDNITITIVRIGQGAVRIGVDAPKDMDVVRAELVSQLAPVSLSDERTENAAV